MCADEILAFKWLLCGIFILSGTVVGSTFWGFFK